MILLFAFFAGVLSVLAPCVLPILPVLLWGGLAKGNKYSPYIILISSLLFIFTFTLLVKIGTSFLPINQEIFTLISAIIISGYGIILIWPQIWDYCKSLFPSKKTAKKLISIRCSFGSIIRSNIRILLSYLCTHHFKYFANKFNYGNFEHHDVYHWIWISYLYHYLFWKRSTSIPPSIC